VDLPFRTLQSQSPGDLVRRGGFLPLARGRRLLKLLEWEPAEPQARWEPWIRAGYLVFAIAFSLTVVVDAFAHETVITILHVNDTHAHLDSFGPKNIHMEGELGGIARAATIINEVRATEPNVLLLHAGDISHGDLFFNKFLDFIFRLC